MTLKSHHIPVTIDANIRKQRWFKALDWEYKDLFIYLALDMDDIGVVEPDLQTFCDEWTNRVMTPQDIDLHHFVETCNNGNGDKKERWVWLDRGRKLWFTPSILFLGGNNQGFRDIEASPRALTQIRMLSQREETRDKFIEDIIHNDRLDVKNALLNRVYNRKGATDKEREFVARIADKAGHEITSTETPEDIKQKFGCVCQYCGEKKKTFQLELEHILPKSSGHKDVEKHWNIVPACQECNRSKGTKPVLDWLQEMGYELTIPVRNAVEKWIKKGQFLGAYYAPFKEILKKNPTYTWKQVQDYVFKSGDVTTSDYECINPTAKNEDKRFTRKLKTA